MVTVITKGKPNEIAALVLELQEQPENTDCLREKTLQLEAVAINLYQTVEHMSLDEIICISSILNALAIHKKA